MNVSLTPHLQRLVDEKIASGRFGTAGEVVREGLRLIEERDRRLAIEELRAKIDIGWQQSERGEGRDRRVGFAEMRSRLVPAAGMEPMKQLARQFTAVPKSELDKIREKEKTAKKKGKKRA